MCASERDEALTPGLLFARDKSGIEWPPLEPLRFRILKEELLLASSQSVHALPLSCVAFTTLERRLVVSSDAPAVVEYVRCVYHRACSATGSGDAQSSDAGEILSDNGAAWLVFNGEPVQYLDEKPATDFRLAFYGTSKLIRLSLCRNPAWHSLYVTALSINGKAIIISAQSGIAKTTLALELMSRGAKFYSDEYAFIRKSDRMTSGLPRTLVIRARMLSVFHDPRLRAMCERSTPRNSHGDPVWDNIDAGDVFGEHIFAQPAELSAAIVVERELCSGTIVEPISAALAAMNFGQRLNADSPELSRVAATARLLQGIPCYRVTAATTHAAAGAIEALL